MGNQASSTPEPPLNTLWKIVHEKALQGESPQTAAATNGATEDDAGLKGSASPEVISERLQARGYTMTDILALHLNRVDKNQRRYTPEFIVKLVADFEEIVRSADAESELGMGMGREIGVETDDVPKTTATATATTTSTTEKGIASDLGPVLEIARGVPLARAPSEGTARLMECCLCLGPMKNPVSLNCGHSSCKTCIEGMLKSGGRHCPICRAHISSESQNNMHVNIVLKELILKAYPLLAVEMLLEAKEEEQARKCDPSFDSPRHCGNWSACGGNVQGVSNCRGAGNCGSSCRGCGASTHWTCCGSADRNSEKCVGPITPAQAQENDRLLRLVQRNDPVPIKDIVGLVGGAFRR
jgi:hypothetical protein